MLLAEHWVQSSSYGHPIEPGHDFQLIQLTLLTERFNGTRSDEPMLFPSPNGGVCLQRPADAEMRDLSCAGGIGSVVTVTASFALVAVSHVLKRLASPA